MVRAECFKLPKLENLIPRGDEQFGTTILTCLTSSWETLDVTLREGEDRWLPSAVVSTSPLGDVCHSLWSPRWVLSGLARAGYTGSSLTDTVNTYVRAQRGDIGLVATIETHDNITLCVQ
ncbi:hypothetical protein RRG08_048574 [Elysia crispata]|uniref:Uncharacterized protein n=1 Tax=Elysia crispata TaxID=231223 RepID=A0AAE1B6H1_9GAST|nr:hypothetical protein RRG08_048574 [Elysia crispata]